MAFYLLKVRYGGFWDDCSYRDGYEIDVPLSEYDMNVYNVRCLVFNYCKFTSSNFDVYILKNGRRGRIVKSRLIRNEQVIELFATSPSPTVYVGSDEVPPTSHDGASSSYVPPFDPSQSNQYLIDQSQPYEDASSFFGNDWRDELEVAVRVAASPNWIDNQYTGASHLNLNEAPFHDSSYQQEYTIPDEVNNEEEEDDDDYVPRRDTISSSSDESNYEEEDEEDEEDNEDDDYTPTRDTTSSSSGESNLYHGGTRMNRRLFAEFTAWIHDEGGMQKLLQMMYPAEYPDEGEVDQDTEYMGNWVVPVVPMRPRDLAVFHDKEVNTDELGPDAMYNDKSEIMIAVGIWHLHQKREFKVFKSDKGRMALRCKVSKKCPFAMSFVSDGGMWTVSRFSDEHDCGAVVLTRRRRKKVHSIVIASLFAERMRRDAEVIKPRSIKNELLSRFGINCSYDTCLRGRNKALEMVYGSYSKSYDELLGYLHMLKETNARTFTSHEIDSDGRFKQVFIALGASITVYNRGYIRPVIAIDATHLKGKLRGVMFVAIAKDANEQLFPLAYGIGPIEDNESWVWFLQCLRVAYGPLEGHLIVSDQHVSIAPAIDEVFPDTVHGFCYYHIAKNLKGYGHNVGQHFLNAAFAYETWQFDKHMASLRDSSRLAYNKLMEIGPEKWSRVHCPAKRFSNMTSNAAESFNNTILWARRLPICACLDAVRLVMEEWFAERHEKWSSDHEDITTEARRKLVVQYERAETYRARKINDTSRYKVMTPNRELTVCLRDWTCECQRWQQDCLPCAHAIAAIRKNRQNIVQYVSPYYKMSNYGACFRIPINSVPQKTLWTVPPHLTRIKVLPPPYRRQAGRPKETRVPGGGERPRPRGRPRKRCNHCGQVGHITRKCPNI